MKNFKKYTLGLGLVSILVAIFSGVRITLNKEKVKKAENKQASWTVCEECQGRGKKSRGLSSKARRLYQMTFDKFEKTKDEGTAPVRPKGHLHTCQNCNGSGLLPAARAPIANKETYPHIAIIGAGIGGVALAVACLHRGIPLTLYERDSNFEARSQGYGLTLQQASKAIEGLGILSLEQGVISTRHVVHATDGKLIGEWGVRKWIKLEEKTYTKRPFTVP